MSTTAAPTQSQELELVLNRKNRMQHAFCALILLTITAAIIQNQFGSIDLVTYGVYLLAPVLWLITLIYIFLVNYKVNSAVTAIFRVIISIIPILAVYVIYRTSYDARKFVESKT